MMILRIFYLRKRSYSDLCGGVADSYAFSRFHDNVGLRDFPAVRHIESANAVIVNNYPLIGNAVPLFSMVHINVINQLTDHAPSNYGSVCIT